MKKWIFPISLALIVYIAFSGVSFVSAKGSAVSFIFDKFRHLSEVDYLRDKNQKLEIEVLNLKSMGAIMNAVPNNLGAKVFATYPFRDRSEIVISVGKNEGVALGDAVVIGNLIVGKIKEVGETSSIVQTIFDKNFKTPVRIGSDEIDALYVGGLNPKLELIDHKGELVCCEIVVSAGEDLPYGLGIGRIKKIGDKERVKEADLEPLFELKNLRNVSVISL